VSVLSPSPPIAVRLLATALAAVVLTVACGGDDEPSGPTIAPDPAVILERSATEMGDVTSVRFELQTEGSPVYIDDAEAIELRSLEGRFEVPGAADAVVRVRVGGALSTELGAVAVDDEVWLSNPVTGDLEPLPAGVELDPSNFFDPEGGWQPLLSNLTDAELVGVEDRDGDRYHVRGIAPAAQVEVITAGLVDDLDVPIDVWIHPVTGLVTAVEFTADVGEGPTEWILELRDYGEDFDITAPPGG
jgi:hypothetical protein